MKITKAGRGFDWWPHFVVVLQNEPIQSLVMPNLSGFVYQSALTGFGWAVLYGRPSVCWLAPNIARVEEIK